MEQKPELCPGQRKEHCRHKVEKDCLSLKNQVNNTKKDDFIGHHVRALSNKNA
jgi:hypothetical protein